MAKAVEEELDETYVVTPKGFFVMSLYDAGLIDNLDDRRANTAWKLFENDLEKHGHLKKS